MKLNFDNMKRRLFLFLFFGTIEGQSPKEDCFSIGNKIKQRTVIKNIIIWVEI
jgi:hypothetical protein